MFKIIGADNKEYGPVSLDQLKQWIAEGRLNAQSKVLPEGSLDWKTVAEVPDLATALPASPTIAIGSPGNSFAVDDVSKKVATPAICLMVVAGLAILLAIVNAVMIAAGVNMFPQTSNGPTPPEMIQKFQKIGGVVGIIIALAVYGTIFLGALRMKGLRSYGLAMTACILALLPCSLCCVIGLPIGIWGLVVLNKPEVKAAFR
jgi:hypothetical protein